MSSSLIFVSPVHGEIGGLLDEKVSWKYTGKSLVILPVLVLKVQHSRASRLSLLMNLDLTFERLLNSLPCSCESQTLKVGVVTSPRHFIHTVR